MYYRVKKEKKKTKKDKLLESKEIQPELTSSAKKATRESKTLQRSKIHLANSDKSSRITNFATAYYTVGIIDLYIMTPV